MPLDRNGIIQKEFVVTFQCHFKFAAANDHQAEQMVMRAISIGIAMSPQLLGIGVAAQPATDEVMEQLGFHKGPRI